MLSFISFSSLFSFHQSFMYVSQEQHKQNGICYATQRIDIVLPTHQFAFGGDWGFWEGGTMDPFISIKATVCVCYTQNRKLYLSTASALLVDKLMASATMLQVINFVNVLMHTRKRKNAKFPPKHHHSEIGHRYETNELQRTTTNDRITAMATASIDEN